MEVCSVQLRSMRIEGAEVGGSHHQTAPALWAGPDTWEMRARGGGGGGDRHSSEFTRPPSSTEL